jgi:cytochrome c556
MRTLNFFLPVCAQVLGGAVIAQTPASWKPKPAGNLKQVMKSIPYPNSNIIFDVQSKAPKDDAEWKTVQNAAIAIAETANLITLRGRLRDDGKPVPLQNANWSKFAQGLVTAGQACYKAALAKNVEAVSNCTGELSDSCSDCHEVYRDK